MAQANPAPSSTVEIRLQLDWWTKSPQDRLSTATVTLEPLGSKGPAQTLHISEGSPTIARLPAGRYQLITTAPAVIDGQAYGWSIELPLNAPVNDIRLSQENAVRVKLGDNIEATTLHTVTRPAGGSISESSDVKHQITALLNRWVSSLRSGNLHAQMSCYGPQLTQYFRLRNVSRNQVQAQKQNLLRLYPQIRQFELNDLSVKIDGGEPTATAVKSWNFSGHDVSSQGHALMYFRFAKIGSNWVITSEQERPVTQDRVAMQQSANHTGTP
jgi:hypothetical protein